MPAQNDKDLQKERERQDANDELWTILTRHKGLFTPLDLIMLTAWLDRSQKAAGLSLGVSTLIRRLLVEAATWKGLSGGGSSP